MGNRPRKNYDYSRPGVAMLTLKARSGVRLCRITPETFALTETGRKAQTELIGIPRYYEQIKIGHYQVMPDHLHVLMHVVRPLPPKVTLQRVIRGFKIGLNRICRETHATPGFRIFDKGMHDTLVFERRHLEREVAYIRDNVRRYRLRKAYPDLFRKPRKLMVSQHGMSLWGVGNCFLLNHPRRVRVQFSRHTTAEMWPAIDEDLTLYLQQGYVFVSAFISPCEQRVLREVVARGGRAIRLTHTYFGERYKPAGRLFDLCCAGKLLEISVANAFERNVRLDRAACLRLNAVAGEIATNLWGDEGEIATTQWSQ